MLSLIRKIKTAKYSSFPKLGLIAVFCIALFCLTNLVTYPIVNYFIKNEMVGWTMYEGFAGNIFYIYVIVIAVYTLYKPSKHILLTTIVAFVIYTLLVAFIFVYEEYNRFYVETNINGRYSFQLFTKSVKDHFSYIFSSDIWSFFVIQFWQLVNILLVIATISKFKINEIPKG